MRSNPVFTLETERTTRWNNPAVVLIRVNVPDLTAIAAGLGRTEEQTRRIILDGSNCNPENWNAKVYRESEPWHYLAIFETESEADVYAKVCGGPGTTSLPIP